MDGNYIMESAGMLAEGPRALGNVGMYVYEHRKAIILLFSVVLALIFTFIKVGDTRDNKGKKVTFMNKSPNGYYYDTDSLTFAKPADRQLAISALVKLFQDDGINYTPAQISNLADSMIIMILEPEDEAELAVLKINVAILVDPEYKSTIVIVEKARRNGNVFANDQERAMVYNLLVRYFASLKTPMNIQLSQWSDALLIRAFKTRRMPPIKEFNK